MVRACRIEKFNFVSELGGEDLAARGTASGLHQKSEFFGCQMFACRAGEQLIPLPMGKCAHETVHDPRHARMTLREREAASDGLVIGESLLLEADPSASAGHSVVGHWRVAMRLQIAQQVAYVPRSVFEQRTSSGGSDDPDLQSCQGSCREIKTDLGREGYRQRKLFKPEDPADFMGALHCHLSTARRPAGSAFKAFTRSFKCHAFDPLSRHYCHAPIGVSTHETYQRLSTDTYTKVCVKVDTASRIMLPDRSFALEGLTASEQR